MTQMALGLDRNGNPTFEIGVFPGHHITLVEDIEQTVVVPDLKDPTSGRGITHVLINHSKASDMIYKNGLTAITTPANGATEGQALNPGLRSVKPGQTLRFLSPIASQVQLEWMSAATTAHK